MLAITLSRTKQHPVSTHYNNSTGEGVSARPISSGKGIAAIFDKKMLSSDKKQSRQYIRNNTKWRAKNGEDKSGGPEIVSKIPDVCRCKGSDVGLLLLQQDRENNHGNCDSETSMRMTRSASCEFTRFTLRTARKNT